MNFSKLSLPLPQELYTSYPIAKAHRDFISQSRNTVKNILQGNDKRLALFVGPCAIHSTTAALEYARKLKVLQDKVKDFFFIIMRCYCDKPRTCLGWKGLINDPDLDESYNIPKGLQLTRQLMIDITNIKIPIVTEILDPFYYHYFNDTITWGMIGARTTYSQPHRQIASNLPYPVGFKNSLEGSIAAAADSVKVASSPQNFISINHQGGLQLVKSSGNPWGHVVLRGGSQPNYDFHSIKKASEIVKRRELFANLVVDCSHGNCQGDYHQQEEVFSDVINQKMSGNNDIKGIMLESNISEGSQTQKPYSNEVSIVDSCLSWEHTSSLIESFAFPRD
ncbi:MAG: 3-deoxy-7-phosphoheptulonate synthase [Chlamydiota bacterium]